MSMFANLIKDKGMGKRTMGVILKAMYPYNVSEEDVRSAVSDNMRDGDAAVLKALVSLSNRRRQSKTPGDNSGWLNKRAIKRAGEIGKLFTGPLSEFKKNAANLLDIGADDCRIALAVGTHVFGLDAKKVYGIDIPQWGVNTHELRKNCAINFEFIDPDNVSIPFSGVRFNRITIMQTLHHVKNLSDMMYEINRVSTPGGIVIIREHDCTTPSMSTLIDIEHIMYDVVVHGHSLDKFRETYYGSYKSKKRWTAIFEAHMFSLVPTKKVVRPGPTNFYYACYQKIGNARPLSEYSTDTLKSVHKKLFLKDPPAGMGKDVLVEHIKKNM